MSKGQDILIPAYELIAHAIEAATDFVNRDELAAALLHSEMRPRIDERATSLGRDSKRVAGNIVDWFSSDITQQKERTLAWSARFERVKVRAIGESGKWRKVWAYRVSRVPVVAVAGSFDSHA